jgi:tetratricopeptide (TPR) repeat protein
MQTFTPSSGAVFARRRGLPGYGSIVSFREEIVPSRKRRSEVSGNRQSAPRSTLLKVFFVAAACIFTGWTIVGPSATLALAAPKPQDTKTAIRKHPSVDPDALSGMEADIDVHKFDEAESGLDNYLKDHPNSSRAYYDLGYVHFRTHKIGPSIKELSKSLELDPSNAEAHKALALSCGIIGRYDLAEVELLQAARLKPGSAEIHYFLARTYYTRGVYPLAKSEFETAIRLDSAYIKAYSNLGLTMEALGKNDDALRNYTKAVQLEDRQEQRSEWPYIYLSGFYNRRKDAAEALTYANRALEINSASDTACFELAKAYRTQKQWQKGADAARRAIASNSQVPDYYYVLGLVLREMGNQPESEEALQKYAQLQQNSNRPLPEQKAEEPMVAPDQQ